jgi:pimeloyl-ACP methyl ester carboxylesterase
MPRARANGIELEYDITGNGPEPVLLIMGLGAQMIRWPLPFLQKLADRGCSVIRFDNRDVGLSSKIEGAGLPDLPAIFAALVEGRAPHAPYGLEEMVADSIGLLDVLGIARAHIVGGSLGGMIAQLIAADHPERTRSMVSIMSRARNQAPAEMLRHAGGMTDRGPDPLTDLEGYLDHAVKRAALTGSPAYPPDPDRVRAQIREEFERCYYPQGFQRQFAASLVAPDRREFGATVTAPAVVIHGAQDPLMPIAGGRETAAAIPGAEFIAVEGMGHDLPPALFDTLIDGIMKAVDRAR